MENFKLLKDGIDTQKLLDVIISKPHLWNQNTLRTNHPLTPHKEVDDILLRFNPTEGKTADEIRNGLECIEYPPYKELDPFARELVELSMDIAETPNIGRCVITKIQPGRRIISHVDRDNHSLYYSRIHLCVFGTDGNLFFCGHEGVTMRTGELWWFNNKLPHHCENTGQQDRIHIIMDVKK